VPSNQASFHLSKMESAQQCNL